MMKHVLDVHCHTVASGHAYSTVGEYAAEAAKKGLELIGITDHGPKMPNAAGTLYFRNGSAVPKTLCGISTLFGAEVDMLDFTGGLDIPDGVLKRLDIVIASYHALCLEPGSEADHTNGYIAAMQNPYIDVIGHPGDPNFPSDLELLAKTAAETYTVLEINNASLAPNAIARAGSDVYIRELLKYCVKYKPFVIAGSDAHFHTSAGGHEYAYETLSEVDYPNELILNTSVDLFKRVIKIKQKQKSAFPILSLS